MKFWWDTIFGEFGKKGLNDEKVVCLDSIVVTHHTCVVTLP